MKILYFRYTPLLYCAGAARQVFQMAFQTAFVCRLPCSYGVLEATANGLVFSETSCGFAKPPENRWEASTERYRSGHNGARPVLKWNIGVCSIRSFTYTEGYRSGHNGADSKSSRELCVSYRTKPGTVRVFTDSKIKYFAVLSASSFRRFFAFAAKTGKNRAVNIHGEVSKWS